MRSRDGSNTILLRLLLIFFCINLSADEYLISLRYLIKDSYLYNDYLWVSKAMNKCEGTPKESLVVTSFGDVRATIEANQDQFFEYLQKLGLQVHSQDKTTDFQNSNQTELLLRTKCFKVDFNDNLAKITAIN